ncbi:MAG TPA: Rne/Rng family ribonuclease [Candidatus Atribacteria bacterium]|nr:Rne/Rng family ribonuclease [Candidatus Atribacteria bacterium]HPT77662.1 Rne/Rng family ribonuclease [Candidatus Atribacteria bacterium]
MGVDRKIIIDNQRTQTRVAVLENDELAEIYIEDVDNRRIAGNIYRGRVANVLPGMQAAFIDIGLEKNAFLYIEDICAARDCHIEDVLREGQELTVQVYKEPIGTKGARVTTNFALPGNFVILLPGADYIGVSKKIEDEAERQRLKSLAESVRPSNAGLIVRTAARGKDIEAFAHEVDLLERLWAKIRNDEHKTRVPGLLYKDENLIYRTLRDMYAQDISRLVINDFDEYNRILEWIRAVAPDSKRIVEYFEPERCGIFEYFGIEDQIEKAMRKKAWLKSGGYIIIEPTEALTVIDVNTGKYVGGADLEDTVLRTNLEAADEIASQIRLRDIGGIIIIDFIDMEKHDHRQMVIDALKAALKRDRTKTNVLGFTGLGLVEMTRKKARDKLSASLLKPCPHCGGTGRVYLHRADLVEDSV